MKKTSLKIAIIGAGFTGLSAAWDLTKAGHRVTIFEAEKKPGGLAAGFQKKGWSWSLDYHYHHIFETDKDIKGLAEEMGFSKKFFYTDVKTSLRYGGENFRLDSPIELLKFSPLPFLDRLRVGAVLAGLKLIPDGEFLERFTTKNFLQLTMGKKAYQVLWEPLMIGKFGNRNSKINMAWFWARIKARSQKLGYYQGGFLKLAEDMVVKLKKRKVNFKFNSKIKKIKSEKSKIKLILEKNKKEVFDRVIVTVPSPVFKKLIGNQIKVPSLPGLGAVTLVLELKKPFFSDESYWLNINEKNRPFLAVVEHTNLTGRNKYSGSYLLYVGKYLDPDSSFFTKDKAEVLAEYRSSLDDLSPGFSKQIKSSWLFKSRFAQPLVFKNHSKKLPAMKTKIEGLYWSSMQQIYPWDRGTNFAVKYGRLVAKQVLSR